MSRDITFPNAPVVETVLGIQFSKIPGLSAAHLGCFWKTLEPEWINISDVAPLPEQYEVFDENPLSSNFQKFNLKVTQEPDIRFRIENEDKDRMIQLQNGRFHYNWLGHQDGCYPRYDVLRPEFDKELEVFRKFVAKLGFGELKPNQWEVTYVNHMKKGTVWESPEDWNEVFNNLPGLGQTPTEISLEGFSSHWQFEILQNRGRLHVELKHGRAGSPDGEEVLTMKLTARGSIDSELSFAESVDVGLELGHDTIVNAFSDLTSEKAHKVWRKKK